MLYSYLLTRSDFNIRQESSSRSRDKRYAYNLYCELLLLLITQSGFKVVNQDGRPRFELADRKAGEFTRIGQALAANDLMQEIAIKHKSFMEALRPLHFQLNAAIKDSAIYKELSRKKGTPEIAEEVQMWKTLIHTVLLRDRALLQLIQSDEEFTHVGFDLGVAMLDETLNDFSSVRGSLVEARRGLSAALDKSYELYHSLLQLMIDLTSLRELQLDEAKHKYLPSHDDLNPNTRFVDNQFIAALRTNADMQEYLAANPISWVDEDVTLRRLLDKILDSDIYKKYMEAPVTDFATDCELWGSILKNIIIESDELAESLENQSVFWNDDVVIMGSFVLKTIKNFANSNGGEVHLLPKFKDLEDERFGPRLFEDAIAHQDEYRQLIDECLQGSRWEPDRLAFMDIVILETAIAELLNFESIPTVVTINEYTEIANYYSTPKSGQFITGMLYSIVNNLKKQGKLVKE